MIRDITIHAVLNGFVVQVGCQTLAFESKAKLLIELATYLDDPEGTERRVVRESVNVRHTYEGPLAPIPPAVNEARSGHERVIVADRAHRLREESLAYGRAEDLVKSSCEQGFVTGSGTSPSRG